MRNIPLFAAAAALALASGPGANAQLFGPKRPPPQQQQQISADQMTAACAQMKAMPNPPMTYDQCMSMAASQQAMQAAQNDPAGVRPGDDTMTCDQIKAEFVANGGLSVNKQDAAQAQAAATEFQAKNQQVQTEAKALEAQETATNAAAGAAAYTPFGNAAAAAAAAQNQAASTAFSAHAQQELEPSQQRMMAANANMVGDISSQMQANPRQARLMALAEQKNCRF